MKIAAWLALCIVVCVKPAMAENAANAQLLSLAPEARTLATTGCPLLRSLLGVRRTWPIAVQMSAFDPKRTSGILTEPYLNRYHPPS